MAKFCENCGNEIKEGADICIKCGKIINKDMTSNVNTDPNAKSRIAAGLLAFFLGSLGVHNFYLGYVGKAVAQLLLTVVGWVVIVGPIVSGIWALVEAIMILTGSISTDAQGNKLAQ